MAFRSLFPSLPAAVQEQWARKQEEGRSAATKWLNSAMTKSPKSGKWRVRCDESTMSTQHTSTRTSREGAEARGYPRFRAVVLAGGEDAFKAALHAGEIREVKGKTGRALYQWSEEVCEEHHDIQRGAHMSSSINMDGEDAAAARNEFTEALDAMSFETGLNVVLLACPCKSFNTMADAAQLQGHPIWQREDRSLCVPLALHGDEAPVIATGTAHSRSLLVVSWRSLVGKRSAKLGNFVSALVWAHLVSKANACHTPAAFWRRLAWSLRALQCGVWPSTNSKGQPLHDPRAGQPLADGHCGILICIQADLAFHPSWLGLPAHNSLEPCQLCGVHRNNLLARPFPRLFTADEWQACFAAKRSPLFSEVPGLSGLAVQPDLMHTKHLGTDQYLLGSTLELLLRKIGPALQACLANKGESWPEIGRFLRHLQPSSWQRKELAPKLKGRAVDIRACTRPLLQLWSIHAGSSREDLQLKMCLERSLQMDQCLQDHAEDLRLPQPVYENFLRATKELLRLYQAGRAAAAWGQ